VSENIAFIKFSTRDVFLENIFTMYAHRGGPRDSFDGGGGGGLIFGAIFSIIYGTNCCPKAVLACSTVNLHFI
jgi:hypothetical protein